MACDFPYLLVRRDPIPHVVPVPCNNCPSCRQDRITMWSDRVSFEALTSPRPSSFLTLTFDDKYFYEYNNYTRSGNIQTISRFTKRLRRHLEKLRDGDSSMRYFAVSEYGDEQYRNHYHFCLCNVDAEKDYEAVYKSWLADTGKPIGLITLDPLIPARIRYCIKYISYDNPKHNALYAALGLKPPVHSMSKGIGSDWIFAHADDIRMSNGYYSNGVLRPLPRYYKDKLGMVEVNAYIKDLPDIWQKYNDRLIANGFDPVDPFDVDGICARGLLDEIGSANKHSRLSEMIGSPSHAVGMIRKKSFMNS